MEMEEMALNQAPEESKDKPIGVYVKVNEDGFVTDVNSEIFIKDFTGWLKIDEGYGDKFAHAQSQYFQHPLVGEDGEYIVNLDLLTNI